MPVSIKSKLSMFSGVDRVLSRRPFFLGARQVKFGAPSGEQKMGAQNQRARLIEAQLETLLFVLYYLNSTYSFHFLCASTKSLRNEAFVV